MQEFMQIFFLLREAGGCVKHSEGGREKELAGGGVSTEILVLMYIASYCRDVL